MIKFDKRTLLAVLGSAPLLMAAPAEAVTILSEDFQGNDVPNNQRLDETTTFYPGWDFRDGPNDNIYRSVDSPANGLPGGSEGSANQGIQFEWDGRYAAYDTTHSWSNSDVYNVTFNATEMNWSNTSERAITVHIREVSTNPSNAQAGALLYSASVLLPQYDSAHDGTADDWSAAQTFSLDFTAGDFSGGTEGTALSFQIGGGGAGSTNRGTYIDNIEFSVVPEPGSLALLGLGGLLIARRRR